MTREFRVVSTKRGNGTVVSTNARTISELKKDLDKYGVDYSDMQFQIRATQGHVYSDSDTIPAYNANQADIIMLTPGKTKNGFNV